MRPVPGAANLACGWIPGRYFFPGHSLTFAVKGAFDVRPDSPATACEEAADLEGDVPWGDAREASLRFDSDFAYWKPQADLLLVGSVHVPGGAEQTSCRARFRVGDMNKSVQVTGDRRWLLPFGPFSPAGSPQPFRSMELRYENAAGGGRSKRNPVGKGRARTRDEDDRLVRQVPNLSAPGRMPISPWLQGPPVGFGPLARTWRPRTQKMGSYRRRWRKTRWPWYPTNFDFQHFNAAPVDQRVPYLRGDEPIELENLDPEHRVLRSQLPGVRTRCFVNVPAGEGGEVRLEEVPLVLDTLWIDADTRRLVLTWRGLREVSAPEYEELADVFYFHEPLDAPPTDEATVRALFERAIAVSAGEEQVAPEESEGEADLSIEEQVAAAEAVIAEQTKINQDALEAAGFPRDYLDQPPPSRDARLQEILDPATKLGQLAEGVVVPPPATGEEERAILAEHGIELSDVEAPVSLGREDVETRAAAGESLAGEDLRELDLSGLTLLGVDFSGADLEGANLSRSDLSGAKLTEAVLAASDLSGAKLTGAEASAADLTAANLAGADLSSAILDDAGLARARLPNAVLQQTSAQRSDFVGADLTDAQLVGGNFEAADFTEARLDRVNFAGACLRAATLEDASGEEICFDGGDLTNLRAAAGSLPAASFDRVQAADSVWEGAQLPGARFPGALLERADFEAADLAAADLSRCEMSGARFERANLRDARLGDANVFRGSFERADLSGADLRGANLYEAETLDAVLAGAQLQGANLRMTKLA